MCVCNAHAAPGAPTSAAKSRVCAVKPWISLDITSSPLDCKLLIGRLSSGKGIAFPILSIPLYKRRQCTRNRSGWLCQVH
jgi:hypothetical protein